MEKKKRTKEESSLQQITTRLGSGNKSPWVTCLMGIYVVYMIEPLERLRCTDQPVLQLQQRFEVFALPTFGLM